MVCGPLTQSSPSSPRATSFSETGSTRRTSLYAILALLRLGFWNWDTYVPETGFPTVPIFSSESSVVCNITVGEHSLIPYPVCTFVRVDGLPDDICITRVCIEDHIPWMILASPPNLALSLICKACFVGAAETKMVFKDDRSYLATVSESASSTAIGGTI